MKPNCCSVPNHPTGLASPSPAPPPALPAQHSPPSTGTPDEPLPAQPCPPDPTPPSPAQRTPLSNAQPARPRFDPPCRALVRPAGACPPSPISFRPSLLASLAPAPTRPAPQPDLHRAASPHISTCYIDKNKLQALLSFLGHILTASPHITRYSSATFCPCQPCPTPHLISLAPPGAPPCPTQPCHHPPHPPPRPAGLTRSHASGLCDSASSCAVAQNIRDSAVLPQSP